MDVFSGKLNLMLIIFFIYLKLIIIEEMFGDMLRRCS